VSEERVVATKDSDFVDSLILRDVPYELFLVSTGNIHNNALEKLLFENLEAIVAGFADYDFIEVDRTAPRFHY